ncbi:hypothetical protein Vadar_019962 [Vaccinium darrowii]|uniref:Uncharacterized protein n=1 Tax=Vaccinium darrowii TaxID=229202 RepID=A0ACB7X264_9ERIC|nr:hypothetical protein Vadar_019962 [Vaccinium darrowii]
MIATTVTKDSTTSQRNFYRSTDDPLLQCLMPTSITSIDTLLRYRCRYQNSLSASVQPIGNGDNIAIPREERHYMQRIIMTGSNSSFAKAKAGATSEAMNYSSHLSDHPVHHLFCDSSDNRGFFNFMPLSDLYDASKGFMVNDVVTVEAQITLISSFVDF